jgi:hypothetical protein
MGSLQRRRERLRSGLKDSDAKFIEWLNHSGEVALRQEPGPGVIPTVLSREEDSIGRDDSNLMAREFA